MARVRVSAPARFEPPPVTPPRRSLRSRGERTPEAVPQSPRLAEGLGVLLGLEADEQLAVDVEHRPFDHRGLRGHQRERLLLAQPVLVLRRQGAEGTAGAVEQGLPADGAGPAFKRAARDAGALVVVELIRDRVRVEPRARTSSAAMARPSPEPPERVEPVNASNRWARALAGTPGPVSATSITATAPSRRPTMRMWSRVGSLGARLSSACTALRARLSSTR